MGADLAAVLERAARAGRPRRRGECRIVGTSYDPWEAQRLLHRSRARFRVLVSGRGVGKTHSACYELLQLVLAAPPGKEGAVLAPTFTHAEAATAKLRELAEGVIPGAEWREQKKRLMLPGGRSIRVYSADRKETVRGPSLVAILIDEGAYLSVKAIEAALPALRGGDRRKGDALTVRLIVATTPAGKNWVWQWWEEGRKEPASGIDRFRFRSTESPFMDPAVIERSRALMSADKFAQEYMAEFVDNLILVFPHRDELFVDKHQERAKRPRAWIGVDLGKSQDWTVLVLMNEWGEAEVLGRWQAGSGADRERFWQVTDERVIAACQEHGAQAVLDVGGPGGAPGDVLAEKLRKAGIEVVGVSTNVVGTKAKVVEQAAADVEWKKVTVLRDPAGHWQHLDHEMGKFQGLKRVIHGQEVNVYEGPQLPGEHDDCVVAFCLANWGRSRGEEPPPDPLQGDFSGFGGLALGPRPAPPGAVGPRGAPPPSAPQTFGGFGGFGR